jgi:hypothetical protein
MQNATNPAATQRKKNQAHKPDKRMQQIMQPRGEEKPPFTNLQNATSSYNKSCIPKENPTHKIMQSKG